MIKDCPECFTEVVVIGPTCECCGRAFTTLVHNDVDWEDFKESDMGFESKVLAVVEEVMETHRHAHFMSGSLCVSDATQVEFNTICERLRDEFPRAPFNVRQTGDDEYVLDFDYM